MTVHYAPGGWRFWQEGADWWAAKYDCAGYQVGRRVHARSQVEIESRITDAVQVSERSRQQ
jgi:hypothetical protein